MTISWNRADVGAGLRRPGPVGAAGTYTAYAVDGSLVSAPVTFRLR